MSKRQRELFAGGRRLLREDVLVALRRGNRVVWSKVTLSVKGRRLCELVNGDGWHLVVADAIDDKSNIVGYAFS